MQEELIKTRPTRIAVDLVDGRAQLTTLDQGHHAGGRLMQTSGAYIRIGLLGVHMPLLGGDRAEINVRIGSGVVLDMLEPSGMVAYNAYGKRAEYHLNITLEDEATLIWQGAEFVAAEGANPWRTVSITLGEKARLLFKEEIVLGRSGEQEIHLNNRLRAVDAQGKECLVEELAVTPKTRKLPGIIGSSKVVNTVLALGFRPTEGVEKDPHRLDLATEGTVYRAIAEAAHLTEKIVMPVFEKWKKELLQ